MDHIMALLSKNASRNIPSRKGWLCVFLTVFCEIVFSDFAQIDTAFQNKKANPNQFATEGFSLDEEQFASLHHQESGLLDLMETAPALLDSNAIRTRIADSVYKVFPQRFYKE